jgi:hypothetical protein
VVLMAARVVIWLPVGCLQRTAAASVAWQRSMRRGTALEDGACGNNIVGRLGLQRTAAGCSAWLGPSGAVQRRKMAQVTSLACCYGGGG